MPAVSWPLWTEAEETHRDILVWSAPGVKLGLKFPFLENAGASNAPVGSKMNIILQRQARLYIERDFHASGKSQILYFGAMNVKCVLDKNYT